MYNKDTSMFSELTMRRRGVDFCLLLLILVGSLVIGLMTLIPIVYPLDGPPMLDAKMRKMVDVMQGNMPPTDYDLKCWTEAHQRFDQTQVDYIHSFCKDALISSINEAMESMKGMMMGQMDDAKEKMMNKMKLKMTTIQDEMMVKTIAFAFIAIQIAIICIVYVVLRSIYTTLILRARFILGLPHGVKEQEKALMSSPEAFNRQELKKIANTRGIAIVYLLTHLILAALMIFLAYNMYTMVLLKRPDPEKMMEKMMSQMGPPVPTTSAPDVGNMTDLNDTETTTAGFAPPDAMLKQMFGGEIPSWAKDMLGSIDMDEMKKTMEEMGLDPSKGLPPGMVPPPEMIEKMMPKGMKIPPVDISKTAGPYTCKVQIKDRFETKEHTVQCHYRQIGESLMALMTAVMDSLDKPDAPPIPDKPPSPVIGLTFLAAQFDLFMCLVTVVIILIHLITTFIINPLTHYSSVNSALKLYDVKAPSCGYLITNLSLLVIVLELPKIVKTMAQDDINMNEDYGSSTESKKESHA